MSFSIPGPRRREFQNLDRKIIQKGGMLFAYPFDTHYRLLDQRIFYRI